MPVIHADNLLLKNFSQKESMFILDSSKYKLFLDNKNDECISYLNAILPAFASSDDVIYYDRRCLQEKDTSAATDVMILEKFRDMENGAGGIRDCPDSRTGAIYSAISTG